jgi:hypothetical protein
MRRKRPPWKGKINLRGRLILTNTSLSSMPIYMMSVYRLYEGAVGVLDRQLSHPIFRRKPNASHMCARITISHI